MAVKGAVYEIQTFRAFTRHNASRSCGLVFSSIMKKAPPGVHVEPTKNFKSTIRAAFIKRKRSHETVTKRSPNPLPPANLAELQIHVAPGRHVWFASPYHCYSGCCCGTSMKQRGVAIRGLVPLVLCASAAARMPLAGRAAFANHAMLRSCSGRGSTLFPSKGTNGKRLWGRRLPHGRRDVDSGGAALGFSSSAAAAAAGVELPDDELDVLVKTTVAALPTRPRVAVVGGVYLNPNTRRVASDQTCSNASTARETAVRKG